MTHLGIKNVVKRHFPEISVIEVTGNMCYVADEVERKKVDPTMVERSPARVLEFLKPIYGRGHLVTTQHHRSSIILQGMARGSN